MDSRYGILIGRCVALLDSYRPDMTSVDEYISNNCSASLQDLDEADQLFLTEVFAGCVQFESVLRVVVDGFYHCDGIFVLGAERNLYKVFTYLAIFRLNELGLASFYKFVRSQDVTKMLRFLKFFCNEDTIRTWVKDEWNKIFDDGFVEKSLVQPLLRRLPSLQKMVQKMEDSIENAKWAKPAMKPSTVPQPFYMTPKKPVTVPVPEPIPKLDELVRPRRNNKNANNRSANNKKKTPQSDKGATVKAPPPSSLGDPPEKGAADEKPVAPVQSTCSQSTASVKPESVKSDSKKKAEDQLDQPNQKPLGVYNTKMSEKAKRRMEQIEKERRQSCQPAPRPTQNWTPPQNESVAIKMTAAAILREANLYKRGEEEELRKLERLEAGEFDSCVFDEWQRVEQQRDADQRRERAELLRLGGLLSKEEAVLARHELQRENRDKALAMKAEAERLMTIYMKRKLKDQARMKRLAETVQTGLQNAKQARQDMQQYKACIVQRMNEEYRALMQQALDEAEVEMRQKMEMIEQIRAMEARIAGAGMQQKLVDLTETGGFRFLSEMSIAELRERLKLHKAAEEARLDALRDDILTSKQDKEKVLMDSLQLIARHRAEITKVAAMRFEERKAAAQAKYRGGGANHGTAVQNCAVEELAQRVEQRRAQRIAEDAQARILPPCCPPPKTLYERQCHTLVEDSLRGAGALAPDGRTRSDLTGKTKSRVALLAL